MLDKVQDGIEENIANMVKLDTQLKKLLAKGKICWLWILILLEIVGAGVMLSFMLGG